MDTGTRVTFVTDIPTPYMGEVLEALGGRVDLTAVFCGKTGSRGLPWSVDADATSFRSVLLSGWQMQRGVDASDYYFSPKILSTLIRSRPEAVVTAGFSVPSAYVCAYSAARRVPFVIYSDGTSASERKLSAVQKLARRMLIPRAAACVALSDPAARRFEELGAKNVFLARHSSRIEPLWEIAKARDYATGSPFRVLTVARLIKRKGIDQLIAAVAALDAGVAEVHLSVVGSGPLEPELRRLAEAKAPGRVSFEGFVEPGRIAAHFERADAFAYPTYDDPFGIAVLEAAASGLPIISSLHAGVTEDLIRDGETGLAVDPGSVEGLAKAVARFAERPELCERLGRAAYSETLSRTPEHAAEGYVSAIGASLGDRDAG